MEVVDNRKSSSFQKLKEHPFVKKVLAIKNIRLIAVALIIALALIIYSGVGSASSTDTPSNMDLEESRLATVLSNIQGAGKVEVMISRNDDIVTGVLVVAEGARDISVLLKLLDATSTVMGVDKSIVEVYQMEI